MSTVASLKARPRVSREADDTYLQQYRVVRSRVANLLSTNVNASFNRGGQHLQCALGTWNLLPCLSHACTALHGTSALLWILTAPGLPLALLKHHLRESEHLEQVLYHQAA